MTKHIELKAISLKNCAEINEKWVQEEIANNPTILGLGELDLLDKERIQPKSGRLDLLLRNPETLKRFECELQLGTTDESHIIRTIEYWDIERRRYPQYDHVAVLIAEDVDHRFLNVIHLFNGFIPLIVLKMTAYQMDGGVALTFTKVIDEVNLGLMEEDEPIAIPTDRTYWEKQSSKKMLELTDKLFDVLAETNPGIDKKYNKYYIGILNNGIATNYCSFVPRKDSVIVCFKIRQTSELTEQLENSDFDTLSYDSQWKQYRIRLKKMPDGDDKKLFNELIQYAMEQYKK